MTVDISGSHRQADASFLNVMPCRLITNVSSLLLQDYPRRVRLISGNSEDVTSAFSGTYTLIYTLSYSKRRASLWLLLLYKVHNLFTTPYFVRVIEEIIVLLLLLLLLLLNDFKLNYDLQCGINNWHLNLKFSYLALPRLQKNGCRCIGGALCY